MINKYFNFNLTFLFFRKIRARFLIDFFCLRVISFHDMTLTSMDGKIVDGCTGLLAKVSNTDLVSLNIFEETLSSNIIPFPTNDFVSCSTCQKIIY